MLNRVILLKGRAEEENGDPKLRKEDGNFVINRSC